MKLSKLAARGIKWTSISQIVKQIIQYLTLLILVVIIKPEEFGLIAMAMVVIGFLEIFKDLGTSSAIIHLNEITDDLLSSVYYVNIFFGLFISSLVFISSSLVGNFFRSDNLIPVLNVLAISFFLSSLSTVQKSLLEKRIEFNKITLIEIFSVFSAAITSILLALNGYGVWSLVIQALVNNLFQSILFWIYCDWKPSLSFRIDPILSIIKYSSNLIGFNIFNYFVRNADYLIIGKFLGERDLGHYYIAYKIMLFPVQNISGVISRVMFPIYSKIKDDISKLREIYSKVGITIALITFPLMLGLFSISDLFANVFFTRSWDTVLIVKLLMILAPIGLIQSIASTTGSIYLSTGKTDWLFRWGIASGIIYITGFLIGVGFGVIGVAFSYLISTFILLYPVFAIPFKIINEDFKNFLLKLFPIAFTSVIMAIICFLLSLILQGSLGLKFQLIIILVSGVLVYTLTILLLWKNQLFEILSVLKNE